LTVWAPQVEGQVVPKGISFPTCISVNNVIGHCSPLASEPDQLLADGDVVKM
jgi:methionine aminopeptidase